MELQTFHEVAETLDCMRDGKKHLVKDILLCFCSIREESHRFTAITDMLSEDGVYTNTKERVETVEMASLADIRLLQLLVSSLE